MLSKEWFIPSSLQKIQVNGIFGEKVCSFFQGISHFFKIIKAVLMCLDYLSVQLHLIC